MSSKLSGDSARLDVELLLRHAMGVDAVYLRTWPDELLNPDVQSTFLELFDQRKGGRPIAHIIGHRGFWTLDLEVNASTLIPRADTECLIEAILGCFDASPRKVLDLGTGTGAIALALASERPKWQISGSDVSADAVQLARRNAQKSQLPQVEMLQGSWFEVIEKGRQFDLIVSNPPYIESGDVHLSQGDLRFEPRSALVAEREGLSDIEHIAKESGAFLESEGWLYLEHGYQQADSVKKILREHGFKHVHTQKDYGGNDRFTAGQFI